ncbi:MAG: hypothetical protein GOU99_02370 [Candidatus Altiarchaeota archaeon]|nr:hypothetical protein [Candidatus Altiarchaeota archaeon]
MTDIEYKVQNIVVTGRFGDSLNLIHINENVDGSVYEPGKFPALRIKKFSVGFLLYSSGNFVCSGAKSVNDAQTKVNQLVEVLEEGGVTVKIPQIAVRNIVVSVDLKRSLRLHELAYAIPDSEYDPEAFPGMKLKKGSTRILIFRTGKVIIPGLRTVEEIEKTIDWLDNTLNDAEKEIDTFKKPTKF